MQNITAIMNANCMMLLNVTAMIIACGTRVRAPLTSSPSNRQCTRNISGNCVQLTHVQYSIKRCDRKSDRDQSNTESNTSIIPATQVIPEIVEHKRSWTAFCQNYQCYDRNDKEHNVADSSNHLQCIQHSSKPEVPNYWQKNKTPHYECAVPSLRFVFWIAEDRKSGNDVRKIGGTGCCDCYPSPNSNPPFCFCQQKILRNVESSGFTLETVPKMQDSKVQMQQTICIVPQLQDL